MSGPQTLPLASFRITKSATVTSVLPQHIAKRQPVPFGDNPQLRTLLERPTWSVRSLLPKELRDSPKSGLAKHLDSSSSSTSDSGRQNLSDAQEISGSDIITPAKLRHLLRLSALSPPKDAEEESRLLKDLRNQIHFVKQIQRVDTKGVEPLVAIRDETAEHIKEVTVKLEDLRPWLEREEKVGRGEFMRVKRPRVAEEEEEMEWDPFEMGIGSGEGSGRRQGRYFVVKKAKKKVVEGKGVTQEDGVEKKTEPP